MKKSILISISTIVLCFILIVGASFAAFTSSSNFNGNNVGVSSVEIDSVLYFEGAEVDNISIDNMSPGTSRKYRLVVNNTSTTTIAYRTVFNVEGNEDVFSALNITVGSSKVEFNGYRGTSSWVRDIGINSFYNEQYIEISLNQSIEDSAQGKEISFDFSVEAIYDNFCVVSSQDDLDQLVNNEYAILSDDFDSTTSLSINKNLYLDLNGKLVNDLEISGDNIDFVELVNGTVTDLVVDAINATVYANVDVVNSVYLNVSGNSFYLKNSSTNDITVNVLNGKVYLDTTSLVDVVVVEGTKENTVSLVTTKDTTITSLVVTESANQVIEVSNKGEINGVTLEGENQDIKFEDSSVLCANEELNYVTNSGEGVYYSTLDGVSYKNDAISFDDFLNNPSGVFYFDADTYYFDKTLLLEYDVTIIGLGSVVFEKENSSSYDSNSLVLAYAKTVIENISFVDHASSNNASSCITSYDELTISKCEFHDFAKNSITLRSGSADIFNNDFYYSTKTGAAGNGIQVGGGATATIEYNNFDAFVSGSDVWSATSVLIYDGGYAYIENNTFKNCYYSIILTHMYSDEVSSFDEFNNTFENVTYPVTIQDDGVFVVSELGTSSSYSYTDEETGFLYVYYGTSYDNIQDAINDANDYTVIYVKSGEYNVETTINNIDSNLHINKPLSLIAVGEVNLVTTLPGNSDVISQQTVYISASDVLFDGFTVNVTTNLPNKALEIVSGNNITIQNCIIDGSYIYLGGETIGDYYILNNKVINSEDGIAITNGAGNAGDGLSVISGNEFSGSLLLTGTRTNNWDLNELETYPTIKDNSF